MPSKAAKTETLERAPPEIPLPTPSEEGPGDEAGQHDSGAASAGTTPPQGWFGIDSDDMPAPDGGKQMWLTDGVSVAEAYRRHSRRRSRQNGRWEEYAYWALVNGAGMPVPFTPLFWRPSNALIAE
jgi:hypothetical protein